MTEKEPQKLCDIIEYNPQHFNKVTLIDNIPHFAVLFALKKGQSLPKHSSDVNAFVYVLEGEIEFVMYKNADVCCDSCICTVSSSMSDSSDSKELKIVTVKKEEIFIFEKNIEHSVIAKKDTKFLVVRV